MGGEYIGNADSVYVLQGTVDVYGGKFSVQQTYGDKDNPAWDYEFTMNHYDAHYADGTAKITIYGGSYYKVDPSNTYCERVNNEPVSLLAEGYTSTKGEDDYYTVTKIETE